MESRSRRSLVGPSQIMVVLGALFVIVGGLVAAVTGPMELAQGSWLAAYLVLVCGVAQYVIGIVQSGGGRQGRPTSRSSIWIQLVCVNVGNAAVVAGTLTREPFVVAAATALLLVAFGIALFMAGGDVTRGLAAAMGLVLGGWASHFALWVYRVFLVLLIISLPVGAVLAHMRAA